MEFYEKGSHDKTAGFMYEIKILTLCMLRGLSNDQDFSMATEMIQKKVGKYDDVVYFFKDRIGEQRSFLLQCKHALSKKSKDKPLKLCTATLKSEKDKDFGVIQYLRSYLEHIKGNKELGVVDGLVLFTNRDVNEKMIKDKDLIELGDNSREFMKFCRVRNWIQDDEKIDESGEVEEDQGEVAWDLSTNKSRPDRKKDKFDSFYSLSMDFIKQLKPILSNYYLDEICFNFFNIILHKDSIELSLGSGVSGFKQFESTVYFNILDFRKSDDGTVFIKGLKGDFIEKDEYLSVFRQTFMKHLGSKSYEFIKKNSDTKVDRFNIGNFQEYFNTHLIRVKGDDPFTSIKSITEDLSLDDIISESDLENFQKLFVLAAGQPNVEHIEKAVEEALEHHPLFQNVDPRDAVKHLTPRINKWVDSIGGVFLDSNEGTNIMNNIYLELMLSCANISAWGVSFRNIYIQKSRLDFLKKLIESNVSNTVQISCKGSAKLLMLQLHQTSSTKRYLYLDLNLVVDWMREGIDLAKFFKASNSFVGIVIDLTSYNNALSEVIHSFLKCGKKAILVAPHNTPINIQGVCSISEVPLETNFEHLALKSQHFLRSKKLINIHGRMSSINDLRIVDDLSINNDILCDLIVEKSLVLGDVTISLSNLPGAYSKTYQNIQPQVFIELLLKNHCKFAISGSKDLQATEECFISVFDNVHHDKIKSNITQEDCLNFEKNIILFRDNDLQKFHSICEKHLCSVIYHISIKIGALFLTEIFNPNYYIERQLRLVQEVTFSESGLQEYLKINELDKKTCFVVAQKSPSSSSIEWEKTGVVFLCRADEAEGLFANKCSQTNPKFEEVHWLELEGMKLILVKSHGSMTFIREYENIQQTEQIRRVKLCDETMLFEEVDSNVVLISDEAGTGKSTTLVYICDKLMTSKCVYMIDLKNPRVQNLLDNLMSGKINEEDFVTKLLTLNDNNSALLRFLICHMLQKRYEETDGLILIFDGIDEVSQKYQNLIIKTTEYLANETKCRICISSRKTCQTLLEDRFGRLAITINAMSTTEQNGLIAKQWLENPVTLLHSDESPVNNIKSQMSKIFGNSKFKALPLYLRLMTEISLRDLEKGESVVSSINNVTQLFEEFVKIRYTIYYDGKDSDRLSEHNRLHAEFAFQLLFPDNSDECEAEEKLNEQISTYLSIGILYSTGLRHFDFIHRAFCEYFCAIFLVNCLKKRSTNSSYKTAQLLLCQDWFWPRRSQHLEMLAQFINDMLWEDFANNTNQVESIKKDRLGRSLEHLYASTERVHEIKSTICLFKDILGRTPLHYASNSVKDISLLFYKSELGIESYHENILNQPTNKCGVTPNTVFSGNTAFETSKWNQIVNCEDVEQHSCLYYAVETRNWEVCKWLLFYGADCSVLREAQSIEILRQIFFVLSRESLDLISMFGWLSETSRHSKTLSKLLPVSTLLLYNNHNILKNHLPYLLKAYARGRCIATFENLYSLCSVDEDFRKQVRDQYVNSSVSVFDSIVTHVVDHEHLTIIKFLLKLDVLHFDNNYIKRVVEWGHTETFKYLISLQEIRNECIPFSEYIRLAILYNHVSLVQYIWHSHKELTTNKDGRTPLMVAADCGNLHLVKYFCENGFYLNFERKFEDSALHNAAKSFQNLDLDIIKYLVQQGANVDLKDRFNTTTLDILLERLKCYLDGSQDYYMIFECIRYLVQDCKAKSKYGDQALREEIISAAHDTVNVCVDGTFLLHKAVSILADGLVRYLLYKGANVYAKDFSGRTVVDLCKKNMFIYNTPMSDMLLFRYASQCSLNQRLRWQEMSEEKRNQLILGDTLLHIAARRDDIGEIKRLIDEGSMFDAVNYEGLTPKQCITHNNEAVEFFDEVSQYFQKVKDNDLNYIKETFSKDSNKYRDKFGKSLLHWAVYYNNLEMADYLLDCQVFLEVKDNEGMTPLHYAVEKKSLSMTYTLLKHGADYNPIDKRWRRLLEVFASTENPCVTTLRTIQTIFVLTQKYQFDEALGILRSFESNPDFVASVIHARDRIGYTLLHHAAAGGSLDLVRFVLSNGGCYNSCNIESVTPLDVTRCPNIYSLLSFIDDLDVTDLWKSNLEDSRDAITNARDTDGNTCFHRVECPDVTKWLMQNNPNINVLNRYGRTPLKEAVEKRRDDLIILLLSNGARDVE